MDKFAINVAPSSPKGNVTATTAELEEDPQRFYQSADIVWMLLSSGLVWLMVPAICLFYSGATTRLSSLKLFRLPLITAASIGFQWFLWGYTLAFSPAVPGTANPGVSWYGWDASDMALSGSLLRPVGLNPPTSKGPQIPELVLALFEGMFASFTAALVCGGSMRLDPDNEFPSSDVQVGRFLLFINIWSLLVYNPVARWTWHWAGWSNQLGVLDFAGGTPVHITSGTTCLAFYLFYARQTRRYPWTSTTNKTKTLEISPVINPPYKTKIDEPINHDNAAAENGQAGIPSHEGNVNANPEPATNNDDPLVNNPPHNVNNVVLGTGLLWLGWLGFNGGSALAGNMRAASACVCTHVAACSGGTTSLLFVWLWHLGSRNSDTKAGKIASVSQFCDGVVIGLVAITPGAGFVPVWSSAIFGVVGAIVISLFKKLTNKFLGDAPLYVFAIHTGGGVVGMILTGAFASADVVGLDGYSTLPFPDRTRGQRVGYQLADVLAGIGYTFIMTWVILYGLKVLRMIFRRTLAWGTGAGFEKLQKPERWKQEATPQYQWRKEAAAGSSPPAEQRPHAD